MEYKQFYRRRLPHFQHDGATYFVTSRLHGSLPRAVLQKLTDDHTQAIEQIKRRTIPLDEKLELLDQQHRIHFRKFDRSLHQVAEGTHHFNRPEIAAQFVEAALYRHQTEFDLICLTVMSNHTHVVFRPLQDGHILHQIMGSLKRRVAVRANQVLQRSGAFWQDENYDRIVRNPGELARVIGYTLNNPVEAGLVLNWQDWPYTWVNPDFI